MKRLNFHAGSGWRVGALGLVLLGPGCAAVRPGTVTPPPAPPAYVRVAEPAPLLGAGASPALAPASAPSAESPDAASPRSVQQAGRRIQAGAWWAAFADPALDTAIQAALHRNYTLRDLRTLIAEGELDPALPRGPLWPLQVGLPASVQRLTTAAPPAPGQPGYGSTFTAADVGVAASYQVDVWGQLDMRRRILEDVVEQQRQNTEALAQTLAEQVTQLWFEILEHRALRSLLERQIRYSQELLEIVAARFEQHLVPRLALLQQQQLLLNTQALLPLIQAQLALLNSKLGALLGNAPNPKLELVPLDRRLPDLPPAPALGSPADLLRESPELRLARARVAEVEHQVSENLAGWLPTVELLGSAGVRSYDFSQTFLTSAVGVRLTWPIFDGGQRIVRARQLVLTVQRRNWQYELALNTAVQRVQDALLQEQKQASNLQTLRAEVALGQLVLREARQLFEQGLADYLPVLNALVNLSNLERSSIQAQRLLLSYRVQLYRALGGTWSQTATQVPN
jgi:outer membrane protein TolC